MNKRPFMWAYGVIALALLVALISAGTALAAVWTDQSDYSPGSVVTISGDNSDGAGYLSGETVQVNVSGPNGYSASCDGTADGNGAWSCQVTLNADDSAVGAYSYTATGQSSGVSQSGTFTDANAPGSLDCSTLTPLNNTHYKLQVGTTVTCTIDGATDLPSGTTSVTVYIKSSTLGNQTVTGSVSGTTITFTFQAPSNGCDTTNVAYDTSGNTANNDIIDDGVKNGSGTAAAGFGYVDSSGNVIQCGQVTPKDLTVSKTATPSFTRTFTWGISKSVDKTEIDIAAGGSATFNYTVNVTHDSGTDSAWQVNGSITVNNPNSFPVSNVDVTDSVDNGGLCTVSGGTGLTVPGNNSVTVSYTCTYASSPSSNSGTNTATATWIDFGSPSTSASGTATFAFTTPTRIVDGSVSVTDTLGGTLGTVSYTDASPKTFTYSHTFSGDPGGTCTSHANTATFTTDTTGTTGSASQTVTVCVGVDLTVSKTATPSFTRTYNWSISKSVDKTLVKQVGGTVTFNYTVIVNETGFTDSNWQVNGSVTVANPNDWEDITANVTDAVDNGGTCTVTGGTGVVIPRSSSVNLPYSCTYSSAPNPSSGTNTATATVTSGITPNGSPSGSASFSFTTPTTTVNKTITVKDTFNGMTTTLGTVTATDTTPYASATYTYSHKVYVPMSNCMKYTNTATIKETGQTASQTIEVCGPAKTGALTMGYWQNKNGQGIITGQAKTGVCPSATWLRQYAPFQDLGSTSTCSQVATYVYNIIKAANASGASMNAMLKAQMLATSLDVYFSDPALGGNKINAPTPIGGVSIDLTMICKMIDSSSGTGTCSGTFENVSSAFGGATSLTVSQMLSYAASQSNAGGSTWYGNVKATQQLAKDAFDAMNNGVAFAP